MDYDAYLNGSSFAPVGVVEAGGNQEVGGKDQGVPSAMGGAGSMTNGKARVSNQTIVLVWFILLALLVMSHVVTLSLQR